MNITHLLNRTLAHWRRVETPTGTGGSTTVWTSLGDVAARVSQPTASERMAAGQAESRNTHNIYLDPGASVSRGDELRDVGEIFEVTATIAPSKTKYLRADCHLAQHEGD